MCSVGVLLLCTHIQAKWVSEYNRDWERSSDTPSQLVLMERDRREKVKATQIWKFKLSVLTMGEVVTMHSWSQYKATLLWESCWRTLVTISCKISSRKKMRLAGFRVLLQMFKPLIMSSAAIKWWWCGDGCWAFIVFLKKCLKGRLHTDLKSGSASKQHYFQYPAEHSLCGCKNKSNLLGVCGKTTSLLTWSMTSVNILLKS